jgi:hypothetical protein
VKAKARAVLDQADRQKPWVPAYALGDAAIWTPKLVREALIDAYRMLKRIGGRIGPRGDRAFWPEFQNNSDDYAPEVTRTSPYHSRMTVTRMEAILIGNASLPAWLDLLKEAPDLRRVLKRWIKSELRGEATKELCRDRGWNYTTFMTHRDRAAGIIAQRLNAAGVEVW